MEQIVFTDEPSTIKTRSAQFRSTNRNTRTKLINFLSL